MPIKLEFPKLVWKEKSVQPALEVSIDFLPEEYQGDWHDPIHQFTRRWVHQKNFTASSTLWMWGCISVNLAQRHKPSVPSWSDFVVQFGMPAEFLNSLAADLDARFDHQAAITEQLTAIRADGWTPICHVEQGRVFKRVDADEWLEVE